MALRFKIVEPKNFKYIYEDMILQFPQNELKPCEIFLKLLKSKKYFCAEIFDAQKPVGYILYCLANKYIWLDFIAVYKKFHSQGYGSLIIDNLNLIDPYAKGIFFEVEVPNKDEPNTVRRIKFYEKKGAKHCDFDYLMPHSLGPQKLRLYCLSFDKEYPNKHTILYVCENVFNIVHSDIDNTNEILNQIKILNGFNTF